MSHSPPQRLIKDSVLSVVTIDNFAENVVAGRNHSTSLSPAADRQWWLDVMKSTINDIEYLGLHIRIGETDSQKYSTAVAISLKNENLQNTKTVEFTRDFVENKSWGCPQFTEMSQVLAENSGFLIDGALTVQCEIRVDAITDFNGIRQFNFHDPFEGCVRFTTEDGDKTFYAMKRMVIFHCSELTEQIAAGQDQFTVHSSRGGDVELFLQLLHGMSMARYIIASNELDDVNNVRWFAVYLFCHIKEIRRLNDEYTLQFSERVTRKIDNNIMKRKLERAESLEELKDLIVENNWNNFESEMMKATVRSFFSFAVDFREGPKKSQKRRRGFFSRVLRRK